MNVMKTYLYMPTIVSSGRQRNSSLSDRTFQRYFNSGLFNSVVINSDILRRGKVLFDCKNKKATINASY